MSIIWVPITQGLLGQNFPIIADLYGGFGESYDENHQQTSHRYLGFKPDYHRMEGPERPRGLKRSTRSYRLKG